MRTGFESTILGIELGTLEVKGEWSDHYTTEAFNAPSAADIVADSGSEDGGGSEDGAIEQQQGPVV